MLLSIIAVIVDYCAYYANQTTALNVLERYVTMLFDTHPVTQIQLCAYLMLHVVGVNALHWMINRRSF